MSYILGFKLFEDDDQMTPGTRVLVDGAVSPVGEVWIGYVVDTPDNYSVVILSHTPDLARPWARMHTWNVYDLDSVEAYDAKDCKQEGHSL